MCEKSARKEKGTVYFKYMTTPYRNLIAQYARVVDELGVKRNSLYIPSVYNCVLFPYASRLWTPDLVPK